VCDRVVKNGVLLRLLNGDFRGSDLVQADSGCSLGDEWLIAGAFSVLYVQAMSFIDPALRSGVHRSSVSQEVPKLGPIEIGNRSEIFCFDLVWVVLISLWSQKGLL
jgi:hypothetical protein